MADKNKYSIILRFLKFRDIIKESVRRIKNNF